MRKLILLLIVLLHCIFNFNVKADNLQEEEKPYSKVIFTVTFLKEYPVSGFSIALKGDNGYYKQQGVSNNDIMIFEELMPGNYTYKLSSQEYDPKYIPCTGTFTIKKGNSTISEFINYKLAKEVRFLVETHPEINNSVVNIGVDNKKFYNIDFLLAFPGIYHFEVDASDCMQLEKEVEITDNITIPFDFTHYKGVQFTIPADHSFMPYAFISVSIGEKHFFNLGYTGNNKAPYTRVIYGPEGSYNYIVNVSTPSGMKESYYLPKKGTITIGKTVTETVSFSDYYKFAMDISEFPSTTDFDYKKIYKMPEEDLIISGRNIQDLYLPNGSYRVESLLNISGNNYNSFSYEIDKLFTISDEDKILHIDEDFIEAIFTVTETDGTPIHKAQINILNNKFPISAMTRENGIIRLLVLKEEEATSYSVTKDNYFTKEGTITTEQNKEIHIILDSSTGIEENALSDISVYPLPANDRIYITGESMESVEWSIELISTDGMLMKTAQLSNTKEGIDISSLKTGLYILRLSDGTNTVVKKIVKE